MCSGMWGRAFASATITPVSVADIFSSRVMMSIGRALIQKGEYICFNLDGKLMTASSATVRGGPEEEDWKYEITVSGPSRTLTYKLNSSDVYHFKYSEDILTPWVGVPPIAWASDTANMAGLNEKRMAEESGAMVGYVVPVPEVPQTTTDTQSFDELKTEIANLRGGLALVESVLHGWSEGRQGNPNSEWEARRLGANPPQSLIALRTEVIKNLVAACGVPPTLVFEGGDAQSNREAWRQFLHGSVTVSYTHLTLPTTPYV